jgi:TatD DNase family protein
MDAASPMMLIDTHCHFDVDDFDADRAEVAARTLAAGVDTIVIPGYVAAIWPKLFSVCASINTPRLLPAPGLHPCYIAGHQRADLAELERIISTQPECVAVGEIGLDYFLDELKRPELKARQQEFFRAQLELAMRYRKPVILHVRKAHQDVIHILHELKFREGGIVHAYSGGIEEARHYTKMGFRLGIGGSLTYDQSKRLRAVVADMPLEALVLESDAPDMVPLQHRDPLVRRTRNSPEFLSAVAMAMADLKNRSFAEVQAVTRQQSLAVLRLLS